MYNPLELVYIVIFYLYKILSSKSRVLEALWYRLDVNVFNIELIKIEKHSILGLCGITKIHNKTRNTTEYMFKYVSYSSIVTRDSLYDFRGMMVYLKEVGVIKTVKANTLNANTAIVVANLLIADTDMPYSCMIMKEVIDIHINKEIYTLTMSLIYGVKDNVKTIIGIPNDVLLMLDVDSEVFNIAINSYIKCYHRKSYNLIK